MDENKELETEVLETAEATQQEVAQDILQEDSQYTAPEEEQGVGQEAMEEPDKSGKSNKKILVIVVAAIVAVALAIGGFLVVKTVTSEKYKREHATLADGSPTPDSKEGIQQGHDESAEVITGEEATKGAEVTGSDALEKIMALSDEALGLKKDDYSFMIAQQAYIIKGKKYVQVIAAEKTENEDGTFSITPYGKYYISFDGKKMLKEELKTPGTYTEIK